MAREKSKYRQKLESGKMLYGPARKIPQWPDFSPGTCIKQGDFRSEGRKRTLGVQWAEDNLLTLEF